MSGERPGKSMAHSSKHCQFEAAKGRTARSFPKTDHPGVHSEGEANRQQ